MSSSVVANVKETHHPRVRNVRQVVTIDQDRHLPRLLQRGISNALAHVVLNFVYQPEPTIVNTRRGPVDVHFRGNIFPNIVAEFRQTYRHGTRDAAGLAAMVYPVVTAGGPSVDDSRDSLVDVGEVLVGFRTVSPAIKCIRALDHRCRRCTCRHAGLAFASEEGLEKKMKSCPEFSGTRRNRKFWAAALPTTPEEHFFDPSYSTRP